LTGLVTYPPNPTSKSVGSTSSSLLQGLAAHDQEVWRRFVRLYGPLVYYWCRQTGLQESDREDIFQDVFRSVAEQVSGFRHDRPGDSFRGWLRTITRSKFRDYFRRTAREPKAAGGSEAQQWLLAIPDDASASEDDGWTAEEQATLFHQALKLIQGEFTEQSWRAFWRTTVDGQKSNEVAEELGMTSAAVRKAKSRVLRRIRDDLDALL